MKTFIQNSIGSLQYPVKAVLKFEPLINVKDAYKIKISLAIIVSVISFFGIFITYQIPNIRTIGLLVSVPLLVLGFYVILRQYKLISKEAINQQCKYYEWGKVSAPTAEQLRALQLIGFSRYKAGLWTDILESEPTEIRVQHVADFRKKLNGLSINKKEEEIGLWVDSWGMSTAKKYHALYDKLLSGMHTALLLQDLKSFPEWKDRIIALTDISESYFDECFNANSTEPQKLIWAWDLWRAITLSSGAFMCGFISEEEAWDKIYKVSDICYHLFDGIEDFLTNMRMGHAYWCNNDKTCYERKLQVESYLNPAEGTERLVHTADWTKLKNMDLPKSMKNLFDEYLNELSKDEIKPIGFKPDSD